MLFSVQLPEKPEPNEEMIQPKSEYLEDQEDVEDLTNLDDDMNDLDEMEDNSRAGPSHDPSHGGMELFCFTILLPKLKSIYIYHEDW